MREGFKLVTITDLHVAYAPNQGYAPYDSGAAGDHFLKNPDGSTYVAPVWPGPSVFPDFTRGEQPRLVGQSLQEVRRRRHRRLLERHERAGDLRHADQDHAARDRPPDRRRRFRPANREPCRGPQRLRHGEQPRDLRRPTRAAAQRPPVRHDSRQLCRRAALCGHLDRRQQLELGPSEAGGAADAEPRPVGFCLVGRRHSRLHRRRFARIGDALVRDRRLHAGLSRATPPTMRRAPSRGSTARGTSPSAASSSRRATGCCPISTRWPRRARGPATRSCARPSTIIRRWQARRATSRWRSRSARDLLIAASPKPESPQAYDICLPGKGWYDYWSGARVDRRDDPRNPQA